MSELSQAQKERLISDLHAVVAEAESLLKATAGQAGEGAAELRAKVQASLDRARRGLHELQDAAREKAKAADAYVHEKPWQAIGVAAGIGLLLGMLIARR
ncbi:DUF883 family protein [Paucibacter sp. APW11]|uniref:DUF883 family protein n=1 Tax=Roseateles aquae TaxID=3077235 RepID=A0ABU3PDP2_9BURK|nr:DUF883 family protein [Paucibacter sp. APW11]MDT9000705.1 DUF883 family protein [Paucibacter sp. APW11]